MGPSPRYRNLVEVTPVAARLQHNSKPSSRKAEIRLEQVTPAVALGAEEHD